MAHSFNSALVALALLGILGGCEPHSTTPVAAAPDAQTGLLRMRQFLYWYLAFEARRDTARASLLNYALPPAGPTRQAFLAEVGRANISPTGYLELNPRKTNNYLDSLRASGYFSAEYFRRQRASLLRRGAALAAARQTENGVAPGFESDEVFNTQDLYQPGQIAHLALAPSGFQRRPTAPVYQLPLGSGSFYFYTKMEHGQCVIDSIRLK